MLILAKKYVTFRATVYVQPAKHNFDNIFDLHKVFLIFENSKLMCQWALSNSNYVIGLNTKEPSRKKVVQLTYISTNT